MEVYHNNDQMRIEYRRKIAMLASYLPESILEQEKLEDPDLKYEETEEGEDPISLLEKNIKLLEKAVRLDLISS